MNIPYIKNMKTDPQTVMLSMGIDDPWVLANAKTIMRDPKQALVNLKEGAEKTRAPPPIVDSDYEEPPPEMLDSASDM